MYKNENFFSLVPGEGKLYERNAIMKTTKEADKRPRRQAAEKPIREKPQRKSFRINKGTHYR
jgi:hypothetical protein